VYIVLNLGLKSIRAIIFSETGRIIVGSSLPLETRVDGTIVEQCAEEWWKKGMQVIREVVEKSGTAGRIRYITVTASSCCLVTISAEGYPLSKVIMVSDKRARREASYVEQTAAYERLKEINTDLIINSSMMLPKILWVKNNDPEVFEASAYFCSPNDYFGYRFTRNAVVDTLNAEKAFYDKFTHSYPKELLSCLDIPEEKLPEVVPVGQVCGQLLDSVKMEMGLKASAPIEYIATTYDAICAFYGSGPSGEGDACDVSGTVTSLRAMVSGHKKLSKSGIFCQYQPEFDLSIVGGSNNLGGGLVEWAKQAFYENHEDPYGLMENEARSVQDGCDGLVFLPYLMGERAPLWNDNARGVFFGLGRHHRRRHMMRAVFESAGFVLLSLAEEIERQGISIASVRVSGGLSRIQLVNQIKADILNKEVKVVEEFETTALGAFLLMGVTAGAFSGIFEATKIVKVREIIFPNCSFSSKYQERFKLFQQVYESLLPAFDTHHMLHESEVLKLAEKLENM
jgi:xylulokinase